MDRVVAVLNKVVGPSGWCEVGPACAECGGCSLALFVSGRSSVVFAVFGV